jgi:hypothetical protein
MSSSVTLISVAVERKQSLATTAAVDGRYLREVMTCLRDEDLLAVRHDIAIYEDTGQGSQLLSDIMRRARCLDDADRITAALVARLTLAT